MLMDWYDGVTISRISKVMQLMAFLLKFQYSSEHYKTALKFIGEHKRYILHADTGMNFFHYWAVLGYR